MCNLKKLFFKITQLSVWQNRNLAFKIANHHLKLCVFKKTSFYLQFEKTDFLHFVIVIFKNAILKRFMFYDLV
jgi:hypothetical protein